TVRRWLADEGVRLTPPTPTPERQTAALRSVLAVLGQSLGESPIIDRWTGVQVRALREALRMPVSGFADHLGGAHRMVCTWEAAGGRVTPRPYNQAALDTALRRASPEVQQRFLTLLRAEVAPTLTGPPTYLIGLAVKSPTRQAADDLAAVLAD